jgi:tetratricopeptide (TPR) repeat protein
MAREALALHEARQNGQDTATASFRNNLAWVLAMSGQTEEAEALARQALDYRRRVLIPGHPAIASSLVVLGTVYLKRNDPAQAEPLLREGLAIRMAVMPESSEEVAETRGLLAESLMSLNRHEEAEPLLIASWQAISTAEGTNPLPRIEAAQRLSRVYHARGELDKAEEWNRTALAFQVSPAPAQQPGH